MKTKEELKTLNDFDMLIYPKENERFWVSEKLLKQEAIKWVKELTKQNVNEFAGLRSQQDINWIKHFFNLTEEEISSEEGK